MKNEKDIAKLLDETGFDNSGFGVIDLNAENFIEKIFSEEWLMEYFELDTAKKQQVLMKCKEKKIYKAFMSAIREIEEQREDSFFVGDKFLHNKLGDYLIKKYNIINIDDVLHIYINNFYVDCSDGKKIGQIMTKMLPQLTAKKRKEVFEYISLSAPNKEEASVNLINFKNGILDLEKMKIYKHTPDIVIRNKINYDFVECKEPNELVDKFFMNFTVNDANLVQLIYEMIGYCFYRSMPFQKIFLLIGQGGNGKTTFLNLLEKIFSKANLAYDDLKDLVENKHASVDLVDKMANIADDCSKSYINDPSVIKKITGDGTIRVEKKYRDAYAAKIYCKVIATFNEIPKINENSFAIQRRLCIIPLNANFVNMPDRDVNIGKKLSEKENVEYIIYKSIIAFKEVLKRNDFTEPESAKQALNEYMLDNNSVLQFVEEVNSGEIEIYDFNKKMTIKANFNTTPCNIIFARFCEWCKNNRYREISLSGFGKKMKELGYDVIQKQINNKRFRIYYKPEVKEIPEEPPF